MTEPLLSQIAKAMPQLSKSQRIIAEYIIAHYDKAAYMTAARLSANTGVSEATVVRFAKRFGFEGYPQLQRALQEMTRNNLTALQRIEVASSRVGDGGVVDLVMNHDIELIRDTMENTSVEQINSAVELLCAARKIYVIGTRSASPLASFMCYYLSLMFEQVSLIDPSNESEIFEQMLHITDEDVVVGMSFPRYSRRAVKAMEFASGCGARTIALTDCATSPLAPAADCLLLARSDMASIVDSLVAPLSLINAVIVATSLRRKDELKDTFVRLERIWEEYDVYEKSES